MRSSKDRKAPFDGKNDAMPVSTGKRAAANTRLVRSSRPKLLDVFGNEEWSQVVQYLQLSPREAEIVRCALAGEKIATTAAQLGLSPHTIHTYRERVFRKLGVRSSSELVGAVFTAHLAVDKARRVIVDD